MTQEDIIALLKLAAQHHEQIWLVAAALAIFFLVGALKSESVPYPLNKIPARYRPFLAIAFGQVSAIIQHIAMGTPWRDAVLQGVGAALGAIGIHDTAINGVRGGREIGDPKPAHALPSPDVSVGEDTDPRGGSL